MSHSRFEMFNLLFFEVPSFPHYLVTKLLLNHRKASPCVGGIDTYGITGIPSTVAGRGDREKSGNSRQRKGGFTHVRAAKMRKTLRSYFWWMY